MSDTTRRDETIRRSRLHSRALDIFRQEGMGQLFPPEMIRDATVDEARGLRGGRPYRTNNNHVAVLVARGESRRWGPFWAAIILRSNGSLMDIVTYDPSGRCIDIEARLQRGGFHPLDIIEPLPFPTEGAWGMPWVSAMVKKAKELNEEWKDARIAELEQRLAEETRRRRELERSRPLG